MRNLVAVVVFLFAVPYSEAAPVILASGLKNPESVCYGVGGKLYVTEIGERNTAGDGRVCVINDGKAMPFATGLDDPRGICFNRPQGALYVADNTRIVRVDKAGKVTIAVPPDRFPIAPGRLNDIAIHESTQTLIVSDSGKGAVFCIALKGGKVDLLADGTTVAGLKSPNGVIFDGVSFALVVDSATGKLHRINLEDRSSETIAEGLVGADGLAWDHHGRLFISQNRAGKLMGIPRPGEKPILVAEGLPSSADCCLAATGSSLMVPDMKSGAIMEVSSRIPGWEVDTTPLAVTTEPAFPKLAWTGWDDGSESGRANPLRPILLTHAGDGSNRNFVAVQQGTIHAFDNSDDATKTKVFLDITKKVRYLDRQNEEGLLGLAFHPKYKQNGEFFVFYTDVTAKGRNIISRFRVKKDNPDEADPASEEILLRIEKPYWNHDGGTIVFGPDGMLYITHGDGGLGNDPHGNGQNLKTMLGKVLRIDVDRKSDGKPYSIPADNPFAKSRDALPEIYAYGIRNIWRMAFDKPTGRLWAGDVGQNIYEEINIIQPGANYGWSIRESLHPFGKNGVGPRKDLREPIWEYHHDLGKSITGGFVYRGKQVPVLQGKYLYADYVSQKIWTLTYDDAKGRVTGNQPITNPNVAVMSFGEDQNGEAYIMGVSPNGRGIHRIISAKP